MRHVPAVLVLLLASFFAAVRSGWTAQSERVYFSALDKAEKPVLGLSAADFELRANGQPAELREFRGATNRTDKTIPVVAWVLLDFNPGVDAG